MIKQEQKELADYVKQVHLSLRCKAQEIGAEKAWEEHLQNEEVLRNYALKFKELAENFWTVNNQSETYILCRIKWIINIIVEYFQNGLFEAEIEKEQKKVELFFNKNLIEPDEFNKYQNSERKLNANPPYRLLDVGSCYNPFGKFEFLEVFPIDLYPAIPEVKKCNFLEAKIKNLEIKNWFCDGLTHLPANFFDIVVFSLFLEYLPSPKQRYVAFVKAYDCLKVNGLLVIVTADSKHAGANAAIMKSWKMAAAQIGFVRTRLEKLKYLYCMVFRKTCLRSYPLLINNIKEENFNPQKMFIIPQDSVDYKLEEKSELKSKVEDDGSKEMFSELPFL